MLDYRLVCVEPSPMPFGAPGDNWHRYVIANRITSIIGYRAGSAQEVTAYATLCIERLNTRYRPWRRAAGRARAFNAPDAVCA